MAIYGADAATIDRSARDFKLPDQFEWKERPGSTDKRRSCLAILQGPGCSCKSPNGAPTCGANLTLIPMSDSSRSGRNLFNRTGPKFDKTTPLPSGRAALSTIY